MQKASAGFVGALFFVAALFGGIAQAQQAKTSATGAAGPKVMQKPPHVSRIGITKAKDRIYTIGPSDILDVIVWREPGISRTDVLVRPDGWISMPLVDDIKAAGLTTLQLKSRITKSLAKFVEGPRVYVIVKKPASYSVYILGNVAKPQTYIMTRPTTVLQAIALAEGFNEWASKDKVVIIRGSGANVKRLPFDYSAVVSGKKMEQNILLEPGDTIVVP